MARRTDPSDDNWQNVKDAKKRKQIQDRLAQRARRQRLRQAKLNANNPAPRASKTPQLAISESRPSAENQPSIPDCQTTSDTWTSTLLADPSATSLIVWSPSPGSDDTLDFDTSAGDVNFTYCSTMSMTDFSVPSPLIQPNHPITVFTALYLNGEIQGIPCSATYSARTPSPTPSIPLPLHPTETQRLIMHPRWIDRLPFPTMRDSLIKLQDVIDEEEIIRDIFTMPSWTIISGRASWDPAAWTMEKEWAGKWGWLMF